MESRSYETCSSGRYNDIRYEFGHGANWGLLIGSRYETPGCTSKHSTFEQSSLEPRAHDQPELKDRPLLGNGVSNPTRVNVTQ